MYIFGFEICLKFGNFGTHIDLFEEESFLPFFIKNIKCPSPLTCLVLSRFGVRMGGGLGHAQRYWEGLFFKNSTSRVQSAPKPLPCILCASLKGVFLKGFILSRFIWNFWTGLRGRRGEVSKQTLTQFRATVGLPITTKN